MSRSYNMSVHVTAYQPKRAKAIRAAATAEWNFNLCQDAHGNIYGDADGSLCGGESEQEFVDRLSQAIWKANGKFCEIQIIATYLESLPHESYYPTPEDYDRLAKPSREVPNDASLFLRNSHRLSLVAILPARADPRRGPRWRWAHLTTLR